MTYEFACPLEGCKAIMSVDADSRPDAISKLTMMAKDHLETTHPDVQKTQEQIHADVESGTRLAGEGTATV